MSESDSYNLAVDCIDKHAASLVNKHHPALIYIREEKPGLLRSPPLRLDFSSLKGLSNCAANALTALGINPGERIALRLPNGVEFPISFLGAVKMGAIPIPTSASLTWREMEFVLRDSGASALITTEESLPAEWSASRPDSLNHVLTITRGKNEPRAGTLRWQNLIKAASAQLQPLPTHADDPAFWLYTSGTAGVSKAVVHAHRNIRAHDARARVWQDLKTGDVIFNTSALNWSYALTCGMLDVWRHGLASVIFNGVPSPENILEVIHRTSTTTFMSVPGIYRRLVDFLEKENQSWSGVRVCLSAGEKLPEDIRERFRRLTGLEIYEGLGMTEHSVYIVQSYSAPIVPGSCGRPLPGQRVTVLRDDLSESPPGEVGVLATHRSCEALMLGYHDRPEEEKIAFRGEWFLSGDQAFADKDGNFYFVGRLDETINAGGFRISPLEVEQVLNTHPEVAESGAVGHEIEPGKTVVRVFVTLKSGVEPSPEKAEELLGWSKERLAPFKTPRECLFLSQLPKTTNGKLQRKTLRGL